MSMNDVKSLSHSKWRCKYHIVFALKYRRQIIYGRIKADVGKILRDLCKRKNVEIIEAECCPDHIHMLEMCIRDSLNVAKQDYDPQGASVTILISEEEIEKEDVVMHLDKSHLTVHTYPESHPHKGISTCLLYTSF